jgi:hypothetical protein
VFQAFKDLDALMEKVRLTSTRWIKICNLSGFDRYQSWRDFNIVI